jgi:hypothetical protein
MTFIFFVTNKTIILFMLMQYNHAAYQPTPLTTTFTCQEAMLGTNNTDTYG